MDSATRRRAGLFFLAAVPAVAAATPPLAGQVVRGRVLESGTGEPVAYTALALADTTGRVLVRALSDAQGVFTLRAPRPGAYYITAERIGYRSAVDGILELGEGGLLTVEFHLRPEPIRLDSLVATAERRRVERHLESQGFYEREAMGFGYFVTPEVIEKRYPHWEDILRDFRVSRAGDCMQDSEGVAIYLDGARTAILFSDLQWQVPPEILAGVEIYAGRASIPLQYALTGNACVILVWTK